MMPARKRAIVLSSGGLDSTTVMAITKSRGFEIYSLSFNYGQRHGIELEAAAKVAAAMGARKHVVLDIDLKLFGGSALTAPIDVPKDRDERRMRGDIPITYVPARNTIFLSCALGWAEVIGAEDIFIGVNAIDYSAYPDCRLEFIQAFERLAALATKAGIEDGARIKIRTPLINMSKAQIIQKGSSLGVDYSITRSCYDPTPEGLACGRCDSCQLRKKGFAQAGIPDPLMGGEW